MSHRMIFGLSGIRGSGKDTIADILVAQHDFLRITFSDPLYEEVAAAFGVPVSRLKDRNGKEVNQPFMGLNKCIDKEFAYIAQTVGLSMDHNSPRAILQVWGSEYRRWSEFGRDHYWIDIARDSIISKPDSNIIVTDCRFKNEVALVESLGGHHLRVRRPAIEMAWSLDERSRHLSETELLTEPVSYEFFNREFFIDGLRSQIVDAIDQLLVVLPQDACAAATCRADPESQDSDNS